MKRTSYRILTTDLQATTYADLHADLVARSREPGSFVVDFSNTHIVTMRRHDEAFRKLTAGTAWFIPDGMPLIWLMNARGAGLRDRVYGPAFLTYAIARQPAEVSHFFLGGSSECVERLIAQARRLNPGIRIAGHHHGYFGSAEEPAILASILASDADFIWVGLGTPRQQQWIENHRHRIPRGILLAVGFAFDVNAGTKRDAPLWMQRNGLTWLFRLLAEPARLGPRYFKYNLLFLWYLLRDATGKKASLPTS